MRFVSEDTLRCYEICMLSYFKKHKQESLNDVYFSLNEVKTRWYQSDLKDLKDAAM